MSDKQNTIQQDELASLLAQHTAAAERLETAIRQAGSALATMKGTRTALAEATRGHPAREAFRSPWPTDVAVENALRAAGLLSGTPNDVRELGVDAADWAGRVLARARAVAQARAEGR